jgi:hypothetical protein
MCKSRWIEALEWCVLALVGLLLAGVFMQRAEIVSNVHGELIVAESIED